MEIWMHPHLCATQLAAFTCRLWPNPLMGLQHSTHFSYRGTVTAKRHGRHDVYAWTPVLIQASFNSQPNLRFLIKHNCHQLKKKGHYSHIMSTVQICWKEKINAPSSSYSLPIPWVTFFLSPPPPNTPLFSPSQQSSTSADGLGSTTADHGGGTPAEQTQAPGAASVYEWVTLTPSPPTPPADGEGGHKVTKRNKGKGDL